jgi:hypothetical protein
MTLNHQSSATSSFPIPTSIAVGPVDVMLLNWPADAALRDALAALGRPRLLLVGEGAVVPDELGDAEDWVRCPPEPSELLLRARQLGLRHKATEPHAIDLDEEAGVLHRGECWVAMSPGQLPVVRLLLRSPNRLVPFEDVVRAYASGGGSDHPASVRTAISRIQAKLRPLGIRLTMIRSRGVILRTTPTS